MANYDYLGRGVKKINELVLQENRYLILDKNAHDSIDIDVTPVGTLSVDTETGCLMRIYVDPETNEREWKQVPFLAYEDYDYGEHEDGTSGVVFKKDGDFFMRLVVDELDEELVQNAVTPPQAE